MSVDLHRFPRVFMAGTLLLLCMLLSSCKGSPFTKTIPLHLSNQTDRNITAYVTGIRYSDASFEAYYYGTPTLPLKAYSVAASTETDLDVPVKYLRDTLYAYLSDTAGSRFFYADIDVPDIGERISLTLRLEDSQLVIDVDWGDGTVRTLRPVTKAQDQYAQFCHWYGWKVISYEEFKNENFWLLLPGLTDAKWAHVYGSVDAPRYATQQEASAHMVRITFPIWKLSNGKKISSKASIWINAAVADEVVRIFTEIYNDPEQFPINSVGGYSWRGDTSSSQHNPGLAIDINPNENYQIRNGQVVVGSFWDPSTSPYSIPEGGSVVRIFAEHGWEWGGNAWAGYTSPSTTGNHDYMHFSYFGT